MIILLRDKNGHSSEPTYRDQKPLSVRAVKGGHWPSQGDAQRPLPPSRTVAGLIKDGRFSRNSLMNLNLIDFTNDPQRAIVAMSKTHPTPLFMEMAVSRSGRDTKPGSAP